DYVHVGDSNRPCAGAAGASFPARCCRSGTQGSRAGAVAELRRAQPSLSLPNRESRNLLALLWLYFFEEACQSDEVRPLDSGRRPANQPFLASPLRTVGCIRRR